MSTVREHDWSDAHLATLARVFETFVPGTEADAPRRARLAAETLVAAADHDELRLLRLALRLLELPPVPAIFARRWGPFSRLDRPAREALLQSWSTSPIGRLRTTYQVLKRLALFAAYADEGDGAEPANRLWQEVGYRPPAPVDAPPAAVAPMAVDRHDPTPLELATDVVIVGSGAGGGVAAARIAARGHPVLVVEQGPPADEATLPGTEGAAFRDLFLDRGTTATADLAISILAGSAVGGGTTINWTTSLEPPRWLRDEWARTHGLAGFEGAETDADLVRLRAELDLQPPSVLPPKDQLILDGAAALGWEAAPTERNAGPCVDCGGCTFGCRSGNKRSGPRSHLAAACRDGARLLAGARVERVELRDGVAIGVVGHLATDGDPHGRPFRVRARAVVVAGGALRTPLLLQQSGIEHRAIGRFLRLHPVVAVAAHMPSPVEMWRGPSQAARSLEHLRPRGGFVIESAPAHPGLIASSLPWEGGQPHRELMRAVGHFAPLIGIVHEGGAGSVGWSSGGHPRITYRLGTEDADTARHALIELVRLGRAGGADRLHVLATPSLAWSIEDGEDGFDELLARIATMSLVANRVTLFSAHQMGSARAGADPREHACDPLGRVRDGAGGIVPGLHVADASLFPTSSGVNPMLTVMALAERSARAVLDDLPA